MLKTNRTLKKRGTGTADEAVACMPEVQTSHPGKRRMVEKYISEHLEKDEPGSIQDIKILADKLGVEVQILKPGRHGGLKFYITVGSATGGKILQLMYTKKSERAPEGHYDVIVDGKRTTAVNEKKKPCLWHAVAIGMDPKSKAKDIKEKAKKTKIVPDTGAEAKP